MTEAWQDETLHPDWGQRFRIERELARVRSEHQDIMVFESFSHGRVLMLDGAGWHGGHALVVPDNISLVVLPPYSPELNPVENVWQYLRANWLAISVFDDYDAIVDASA